MYTVKVGMPSTLLRAQWSVRGKVIGDVLEVGRTLPARRLFYGLRVKGPQRG